MNWEWLFIVPHKMRTRRHPMKILATRQAKESTFSCNYTCMS